MGHRMEWGAKKKSYLIDLDIDVEGNHLGYHYNRRQRRPNAMNDR